MKRRLKIVLGTLAGLFVVGWFVVYFVVGWVAEAALETRGLSCHPIDMSFALDLSRAELGPTRCTLREGRVRSIRLLGGATVYLDEEHQPTWVHVRGVEVTTNHDPPHRAAATLVETGEFPASLQRAFHLLAHLAEREDLPRLVVDRVLVQRGTRFITLTDVVVDRVGDAVALRAAVAEPPPVGSGMLRFAAHMRDVRGRATTSDVRLSGRIEVEATIGRHDYEEVIPFRLEGRGLDGEDATFTAHVELSERLQELRERSLARRQQQAREAEEERPDPRVSLHELAESLRMTAERMREEGNEDAPRSEGLSE